MPPVVLRPSILKDHANLIDAFKKGTAALRKRVLENAYTISGARTVFTKDAFGLLYTNGEIFGTFGWNFPSIETKDIVCFFPAFEEFSANEYVKWAADDVSLETFKQMELTAIDALKKDLETMYAQLKPEIMESMLLIKTALFGPDYHPKLGAKRKSDTEKDAICYFTDNTETAIADIRALHDVCSHAEKYLMMIIVAKLPDE